MVIHNLQTEFRLLVANVHTRHSKNIVICAQIERLDRDILMPVCVCRISAFGSVRFPLCRYTLFPLSAIPYQAALVGHQPGLIGLQFSFASSSGVLSSDA